MLRIISGKYRSRKIEQPDLEFTRPTTDRIREAIFSSIRQNIENKIILDLFSGSGAISFEAISNYCMKAIAVDNNNNAINIIKKNASILKANNIDIVKMDALQYLQNSTGRKFDYIFLDPPYDQYELLNNALQQIKINKYLNKNGLIIVETNDKSKIKIPDKFLIQKEKQYGKIFILFISKNN
ncbi:16S rRNA (guanine(966)-N(2))-methyltransferase RsmD [Mycoplasmopsis lipofaciens]|uniref:16S rRNA (guanine(966)-N(2))-methyltransferase RsmD n=1 Tax=Mycoplasmopsis lipofaciens TaxID=114884 RepID=UPI000489C004|nr:16S rRNA (guanine(966)-N(2))-methyltransferase RsmD [Mycoplasmopsis lipofaciens]